MAKILPRMAAGLLLAGCWPAPIFAATIVDCQVGFGGEYKLGLWTPAVVTIEDAAAATVEVVAPDGDGVPTRYLTPAESTAERHTVELFIKVGRRDTPLEVRLVENDGDRRTVLARTQLAPGNYGRGDSAAGKSPLRVALSPTSSLIAELHSPAKAPAADPPRTLPNGLLKATLADRNARATHAARVAAFDQLPTRWVGYEGIDCLLLALSSDTGLLTSEPDSPRVKALVEWVEMGGRLVISGGPATRKLAERPGPLNSLLPGKLAGFGEFNEPAPLERYAENDALINDGEPPGLGSARLDNLRGEVLARLADGTGDALIVRSRLGLGEVTFVTIDLYDQKIASWEGMPALVARLCRLRDATSTAGDASSAAPLATAGYTDLSAALGQRLGANFVGVTSTPMLAIVAAAMFYLALIGPIDYFLLKRFVGRMEGTWITFPLIAILFGMGAYLLAERAKGAAPRLNQVALVDVDVRSGKARGTLWAQAYSPAARRENVSLALQWADGSPVSNDSADHYVSWLGMTGGGLGGLSAPAGAYTPSAVEYVQPAMLDRLLGLPINRASTKPLTARWHSPPPPLIDATLASLQPGTVDGTITNLIDADWQDAVLLFDGWAWRLGKIPRQEALDVAQQRSPVKLNTFMRDEHLSTGRASQTQRLKSTSNLSIDALLYLMMFTDALGSNEYTNLGNQFQGFTDLSNALEAGNAVLVARTNKGHNNLLSGGQAWTERTAQDRTYYRFILPVKKSW